jgi:thiol-disulfide isomerase/thioredoxin
MNSKQSWFWAAIVMMTSAVAMGGQTHVTSQSPRTSQAAGSDANQSAAEARIVAYIRGHLEPGQPLRVSELYSKVFTTEADHRALDKLYNAFFRIPLFIASYQQKYGKPPTLAVISQQFHLEVPGEAEVLLDVMQSDPRVPHFLSRDPKTGQITHVNIDAIRNSPEFNQALEHKLSGWEGKPAPWFSLLTLGGGLLDSTSLRGKVALLYVWFTGCPPCMQQTPVLVKLEDEYHGSGLEIIGANADVLLGLEYTDEVRRRYVTEKGIKFPVVYWTKESDRAFGGIVIYPTMFLIGRNGVVLQHWVGFTGPGGLEKAVGAALASK